MLEIIQFSGFSTWIMYSISLDTKSHLSKWRMLETHMSLNILFSSRWGKFWPKRFKIGLFLKQKYEKFRGFFEIFRNIWGIFRRFLRISGKIFGRVVWVIAWFVAIFGINTTSDISKLSYVISRAVRLVKFETILKYHEWYLCQISRTNHATICLHY